LKEEPARQRLGRGLAALLGETQSDAASIQQARAQRRAPLEHLRPNPFNPRKTFNEAELNDLADSIKKRGVLQPILVRSVSGAQDSYEIIAGERRWRAAQRAGIFDVPVNIIEASDKQALEIAIVENVQRTDLNPIEEAYGYQKLCVDFGYTHSDLAREIGKSRSHVANTLRLLNLPNEAREMLASGQLTAGHARALLGFDDPALAARDIAERSLSVRDVEDMARNQKTASVSGAGRLETKSAPDANIAALSKDLTEALGLEVTIKARGARGAVTIHYSSLDQLDTLRRMLTR
jgi:ParB family transcriptional regulator, chromosome partitioning protein